MEDWWGKLEKDDYTFAKPATCLPACEALRQYSNFPVLFRERETAENYGTNKHNHLKPVTGKASSNHVKSCPAVAAAKPYIKDMEFGPIEISLMGLPGELRNAVYRLLLLHEHPIEYAPPRSPLRFNPHMLHQSSAELGLLRVNKQVRHEAASVYYGENEFRFSYGSGWYLLLGFLYTIGSPNIAHLRKVAVAMATSEGRSSRGTLIRSRPPFTGPVPRLNYAVGKRKSHAFNWKANARECMDLLVEGCKNLSILRFILPVTTDFTPKPVRTISTAGFHELRVCLIDLRENGEYTAQPHETKETGKGAISVSANGRRRFQTASCWAAAMGWEYTSV